eukprot:GAHX01002078.1.p2 GENE.GAHX01002078.1~~GAHX01002078.1.p2  ORF type:complete len:54 (-),score=5.78 GAHX01002078.1:172-333(-)
MFRKQQNTMLNVFILLTFTERQNGLRVRNRIRRNIINEKMIRHNKYKITDKNK